MTKHGNQVHEKQKKQKNMFRKQTFDIVNKSLLMFKNIYKAYLSKPKQSQKKTCFECSQIIKFFTWNCINIFKTELTQFIFVFKYMQEVCFYLHEWGGVFYHIMACVILCSVLNWRSPSHCILSRQHSTVRICYCKRA